MKPINLVVTDMDAAVASYRKLGLNIPDTDPQWQHHHRTATFEGGIDLDLDSSEFARHWNRGWRGGMGVLGFKVGSRERVDEVYADLVAAGYRGSRPRTTPSGERGMPSSRTRTGTRSGSRAQSTLTGDHTQTLARRDLRSC